MTFCASVLLVTIEVTHHPIISPSVSDQCTASDETTKIIYCYNVIKIIKTFMAMTIDRAALRLRVRARVRFRIQRPMSARIQLDHPTTAATATTSASSATGTGTIITAT